MAYLCLSVTFQDLTVNIVLTVDWMTELYPVYVLVLIHKNALIMAIILLKTRSVVLRGVAVGRLVCLQSRNIILTQSNMLHQKTFVLCQRMEDSASQPFQDGGTTEWPIGVRVLSMADAGETKTISKRWSNVPTAVGEIVTGQVMD